MSFTCQANGLWKTDLLNLCGPSCKTVADLRKLQPTASPHSDSVLLTLAGIHILQKFFAAKKDCWTLVVSKAFNAVIKEAAGTGSSLNRADVQQMVD